MTIRIATWNMQSVFPVRSEGKWGYVDQTINADVAILTEAKPDSESHFQQIYQEGGLGKRRRWGTIVAARTPYDLTETRYVKHRFREHDLYLTWPGSVVVCDVFSSGKRVMTVAGVYATTVDRDGKSNGDGWYTAHRIVEDLVPLFRARRNRRIIVAGDLNLWPEYGTPIVEQLPVVDLVELTAGTRPESPSCVCEGPKPCRHIWTHNNSFKGKVQQIDFMFATGDLADRLSMLTGGPDAFPDIWEWSDHAPLVAEFKLDVK